MGTTNFNDVVADTVTTGSVSLTTPVVDATAATLAVTAAAHGGRTITLNRAAGVTATLPAATGSGVRYKFVVATSVTSNADIIKVANSSDTITGTALLLQDGGDTVVGFQTGATDDTISLNGTTTGGLKGAHVVIEDIATNLWHAHLVSDASGTEATPFSATV